MAESKNKLINSSYRDNSISRINVSSGGNKSTERLNFKNLNEKLESILKIINPQRDEMVINQKQEEIVNQKQEEVINQKQEKFDSEINYGS
mmetsp:Transcript_4847/g.4094  ORF Transcript_4847/g.4094 Transcript_4847/m.4094 type:complete len:91 (-) Transcript_4847:203-475(-)